MPSVDQTLAIIVSQESPHLAATYAALADQTHTANQILIAAKAPESLPSAIEATEGVAYEGTFSHGVEAALSHYQEHSTALPTWLWLLHDDSIPNPDALEQLLRAVAQARAVGIAGSKQVRATRPDELISVGTSYTRFGARYTGVEPGDLDQGQLDGRDDIYAVGTAGMLIRTELWQKLGGAEPVTTPWLDGLDLSRKAHLNGHRVIVVPQAVVRHHRQSLNQGNTYPSRRRAITFHKWATSALALLPLVMLASIFGGALRALWRIATKQFTESWADLTAGWRVLAHPIELIRARRRYARIKKVPRSQLGELLTPISVVRAMRSDHRRSIAESRKVTAAPSELELKEKAALTNKRRITLGVVLAIPIVMSFVAFAPTVLRGPVVAAALSGADSTWAQLWQQVASGWIASGDGIPGPTHPIVAVLFTLNTLMGGFWGVPLWVTVAAILALAPFLSTWGAWIASGAASRSLLLRAIVALAWGTGPALWLFLGDGALAEVMVYTALPWWIYAVVRTMGLDLRDVISSGLETDETPVQTRRSASTSMAAAASGGLLLALITMNIPAAGIFASILSLVALLLSRKVRSRGSRRRIWLMQIPLLVAIAPLIITLITVATPQGWWQLVTSPTHPTWHVMGKEAIPYELWFLAGALAVMAMLAILRSGRRTRAVLMGWIMATIGVAVFMFPHIVGPHIVPYYAPQGSPVLVTGLIFAWAGWCVAVTAGWGGIGESLQERSFGLRHLGLGVMALVSIAAIIASTVLWPWVFHLARTSDQAIVAAEVMEPLAQDYVSIELRTSAPLSAMGRQVQSDPSQGRVLALQNTSNGTVAQVWRGPGVQLAQTPIQPLIENTGDLATENLRQTIANLAAGGAENIDQSLAQHGIQLVVIPPADSQLLPGDEHSHEDLLASMEGTDGVDFVTNHSSGAVYRVDPRTPNARALVMPHSSADSDIPPLALPWSSTGFQEEARGEINLPAGGQLILAERRSTAWKATLDGTSLRSITVDWRQTFDIPAGATGMLEVRYEAPLHGVWLMVGGLTLLIFGLLSVPISRRSGNEPT